MRTSVLWRFLYTAVQNDQTYHEHSACNLKRENCHLFIENFDCKTVYQAAVFTRIVVVLQQLATVSVTRQNRKAGVYVLHVSVRLQRNCNTTLCTLTPLDVVATASGSLDDEGWRLRIPVYGHCFVSDDFRITDCFVDSNGQAASEQVDVCSQVQPDLRVHVLLPCCL